LAKFNTLRAFQQIREESKREQEAAAEVARRKQEAWAAYRRRNAALNQLISLLLPSDSTDCTSDVRRLAALMIEYAQTLPAEWVKARVRWVRERMTKMAADEKVVPHAGLKEILLHLLQVANRGDEAQVAEVFREALRCNPGDVDSFGHRLVNWLADKVVDTWPPLPDELKNDPPAEEQVSLEVEPIGATREEWLSATDAVERAEKAGYPITLKWLTKDAPKYGVKTRPRQLPGRHRVEVEWNSLAGCLLRAGPLDQESDEEAIGSRLAEVRERTRRERPLD
jgi:hypothetical protein